MLYMSSFKNGIGQIDGALPLIRVKGGLSTNIKYEHDIMHR